VSDVRLIAFYLPQFHPIPENDAWWGAGFTEWTSVRRAKPNFAGHHQPHVPTELGYYDLRDAATREAQAALARAHGIHGFCYYYYWFNGRRLLERPLAEVAASGAPEFPFCVCWANENWTRRWDGGNDEVLVAQDYSPENERALIADLLPLFRDPRYIRVGGRPLLLVYRANLLPEPRRATDAFRRGARAAGEAEPYLAMVHVPGMPSPLDWGFDAGVEFPPHSTEVQPLTEHIEKLNPDFVGDVWDYVSAAQYAIARPLPEFPFFRGVMVGWDNTPRLQNNGHVFVNSHPENYRRWLAAMIAQTRQTKPAEQRIVFINAWNEWGEGCYLEPDAQFGRGYLEATRTALDAATPGIAGGHSTSVERSPAASSH
jgi:lipopolysaccharide biosynthesis protein